jgi:hypothetical protein
MTWGLFSCQKFDTLLRDLLSPFKSTPHFGAERGCQKSGGNAREIGKLREVEKKGKCEEK